MLLLVVTPPPPIGTQIVFGVLSVLCLGGALLAITRKNLVTAIMALVVSFFGLAGLYAMLVAHFMAVIQVLVYAGGIMVLFIFVIMVLNQEEQEPWWIQDRWLKAFVIGFVGYFMARLGWVMYSVSSPLCSSLYEKSCLYPKTTLLPNDFGSVQSIGRALLGDYLFLFEGISLVLIIAVVGALVVARGSAAKPTSSYEGNIEQRTNT